MKNTKSVISFAVLIIFAVVVFLIVKDAPKDMNNNDVQSIENGELLMTTVTEGSGDRELENGNLAVVHYVGTLSNGQKFDSSLDRGEPFVFMIGAGQVIEGWDIGLLGMKVGEVRRLVIPPQYGYGDRAIGQIPAGSTLVFEVELIDILEDPQALINNQEEETDGTASLEEAQGESEETSSEE